eukprot:7547069-Pyramimonas_sp.AAC.1
MGALDTPCQQAAVNARDRVFNNFIDWYYKQVDEHKMLVLTRLKEDKQLHIEADRILTSPCAMGANLVRARKDEPITFYKLSSELQFRTLRSDANVVPIRKVPQSLIGAFSSRKAVH